MPLGLVPDIGYRVQRTFLTSDWVRARFIACPTCRVRKYPPPRVLSFALAFIRPAVALAWPIRRRHHLHNTPPYKDRKGRQARARYCGVVWRGVVWCGVVWCGVVWCGVVWCGMVWCGVVLCGVVWCGVVWCGVLWCGVVWCGVVWCGVVWCGVA